MRWDNQPYHSFTYEMKQIFGEKIIKLSLDGGFSCPNRDGTIGSRGCIFCGEEGAGEFAASRTKSIREQIKEQKDFLSKKWNKGKYIAYFQNFTNTYSSYEDLEEKYYAAISEKDVVGLAIATRPDCLSEEILDLLAKINQKTFLWIELGLQTIHETSAKLIRRGYPLSVYNKAIRKLKEKNIRVVTHLIIGLPNEDNEKILESVKYIGNTNTWGIKLHSLYIQEDTDLYKYYLKHPFPIISMEEYIKLIADAIELLPSHMIIHRLTGDGKRSLLVEPKWSLNKRQVLNSIYHELKSRNSYQGCII